MWHLKVILVVLGIIVVLCRHRQIFSVLVWCLTFRKLGVASSFAKAFLELAARGPSPVVLPLGKSGTYIVTKPEHMQVVLNSPHCIGKPKEYRFFRVNRGLFASPAHVWSHDRKVFGPAFGPLMLPRFADIINEKVALFVQLQQDHVGRERNISDDILRCFMDIILSTSIGQELDVQRSLEGRRIAELQNEIVHLAITRTFTPWLHWEFIYRFTKAYKRECEMFEYAYSVVDKYFKKSLDEYDPLSSNKKGPKIFMEKLIELTQASGVVDTSYVRDHMLTTILAGSDTTMTSVGNTLLMLAVHQDVQERVYQEVVEAIGTNQSDPISIESTAKFTYLEMVIKESIRLFPVAGIVGRKAKKDIILDENNTIPVNAAVSLAFYQLHRDPAIWGPSAAEFDPERFQPEIAKHRHPYAFLPFSGGPRMCVGMRYAWLSMKITLGQVLRKYRLRTSLTMDEITLEFGTFMRIEQGCQIWFELR